MPDETRDISTDAAVPEPVVSDAPEALEPVVDADDEARDEPAGLTDDEILSAALADDEDEEDDDYNAESGEPKAITDLPAPTPPAPTIDPSARGLEILITERGFTPAQAKRMLEGDPQSVSEIGQASIDADAAGQPEAEAEPEAEAKPEAEAVPEPEAVTDEALAERLTEILGETFDKAESRTLNKAITEALRTIRPTIANPATPADPAAENAMRAQVTAMNEHVMRVDAQLSEMLARAEIGKLSEIHPELKDEAGVARVFEVANRIVKSGSKFNSMAEMIEAAATIAYSSNRTAEIKNYKGRVEKHRASGAPTQPGTRAGEGKVKSRDDVVLEMSYAGATKEQIFNELSRMSN